MLLLFILCHPYFIVSVDHLMNNQFIMNSSHVASPIHVNQPHLLNQPAVIPSHCLDPLAVHVIMLRRVCPQQAGVALLVHQ